jgi:hypothetical protein
MSAQRIPPAPVSSKRYGCRMRSLFLGVLLIGLLAVLIVPVYRQAARWHEWRRVSSELTTKIMSVAARRPADVPAEQWREAVRWTANLIVQVYFGPSEDDPNGLQRLCDSFDDKIAGDVDLTTLQWVWDECEKSPRGTAICAINFRDARLLTKQPITDNDLPNLWSLHKYRYLDLSDSQVTDAGLKHLEGVSNLEVLSLSGCRVTDEGIKRLQKALPKCSISR